MPTLTALQELLNECKWTWATLNGINGFCVTGPNGNAMFLPAAGYRKDTSRENAGERGYYWSANIHENKGYIISFYGLDWGAETGQAGAVRYYGLPIRPIYITNNEDLEDDKPLDNTISGTIQGHDYVDLGLPSGLLWATCNIGANSPEKYGNYYAFGESATKKDYTYSTYKWAGSEPNEITENLTLKPGYDAATQNWGNKWRMPTIKEIEELMDNCTIAYEIYKNSPIVKIIGSNGKNIIFPLGGLYYQNAIGEGISYGKNQSGHYWSSTLSSKYILSEASCIRCGTDWFVTTTNPCYEGRTIRPVSSPQ